MGYERLAVPPMRESCRTFWSVSSVPPAGPSGSLRATAISGGLWTGAQVVLNRGVSLLGTLALMYILVPEQFGIASVAISIQSLVMVLPAFTLSDVLLTRPEECRARMREAMRLCWIVTILMSALLVGAGHLAAHLYRQPAFIMAGYVIAWRPIADLMLFAPQTRLRADLRFARMAKADAIGQTASTVVSVAMAAAGAGFVSILLPPILFTGVRAFLYGHGRVGDAAHHELPNLAPRPLVREYMLSGLGQYVHGGLVMIPPVLIAQFSDERHAGWFSTSFALSASINTVVAVSVGLVLQPVFAQMSGDRARQAAAFSRSCAAIAAVAMPACLLQAVLLGPAFRLMLPDRWSGAISMGVVMSVGQAFYFAVNPAMGLLKAQGRFRTFLAWQAIQLACVSGAMIAAALLWREESALAIVSVYGLYHVVFSPAGVWLCVRGSTSATRAIVEIFLKPVVAAAVVIVPAAWAWSLASPGPITDLLRLLTVPALALLAYPLSLRRIAPSTHAECGHLLASVTRGRFGRSIGESK